MKHELEHYNKRIRMLWILISYIVVFVFFSVFEINTIYDKSRVRVNIFPPAKSLAYEVEKFDLGEKGYIQNSENQIKTFYLKYNNYDGYFVLCLDLWTD